eukprot:TRINITY_DN5285_c0_g1_i1.p1 TRINITY_DN5285_c0_g1~~TRINITY_DN5285_c0_g1_i1.p1  ORF type:complete len:476 (+),score=206.31 TRINITY_DN5285_c0_g1_i1:88-1428(+)
MADEWPDLTPDLAACGGFTVDFFKKIHDAQGHIVKGMIMGQRYVSFDQPDAVKEVHQKCTIRPPALFALLRYLGKENLMFQTDPVYIKQLRLRIGRMLQETSTKHLMHQTAFSAFSAACQGWLSAETPLHAAASPVVYDIMGKVMFGSAWSDTEVGPKIKETHLYLIDQSNRWAYVDPAPVGDPDYDQYCKSIEDLRLLCAGVYDRIKEQGAGEGNVFKLVLDEKNDAGEPFFGRDAAIGTIIGFLNAAYDTMHSTLCWAIFNLAKFPEVQEKVREELRGKGWGAEPTMEQGRELPYMDAFIAESQRTCPTTPFNLRYSPQEDVTIAGTPLEKGTMAMAAYFILFQNKAVFGEDAAQPGSFNPERFLTPDGRAHVERNNVLTPFGGGRRMCLGFLLGQIELRAILCSILLRARVSLPEDVPLPVETVLEAGVLQPKKKFNVAFSPL